MCEQVVVEGGQLTAPDTAVTMGTFVVSGIGEAFGDGTPLHGEVVVVVEGGHLVDAPTEGTVVEHDAVFLTLPNGISAVVDIFLLSASDADKADDVVTASTDRTVANGDARVGSCLASDGGVVADVQVAVEGDNATHVKDDDFLAVAADGTSQRTCATVFEVGDVDDLTSTSASDIASMSFSPRESGCLGECDYWKDDGENQ